MPDPKRLVIWRHGQTLWNREHRFQGQTDVELDELGVRQARAAARLLALLNPDQIYSSDLSRAMNTAAPLADLCELPVLLDKRLRETDGGAWEGKRREEILQEDADAYRAWLSGEPIRPGGHGEDRMDVGARVMAAINDALDATPAGGTAVVVTHGGASRAVLAPLLNRPFEQIRFFGVMRNAAWSVFLQTHDDDHPWSLLEYNARSLPEPAEADD